MTSPGFPAFMFRYRSTVPAAAQASVSTVNTPEATLKLLYSTQRTAGTAEISKSAHMPKYPDSRTKPGLLFSADMKFAGISPIQKGVTKSQKIQPITAAISAPLYSL